MPNGKKKLTEKGNEMSVPRTPMTEMYSASFGDGGLMVMTMVSRWTEKRGRYHKDQKGRQETTSTGQHNPCLRWVGSKDSRRRHSAMTGVRGVTKEWVGGSWVVLELLSFFPEEELKEGVLPNLLSRNAVSRLHQDSPLPTL